jgi:hypothetical protein
MPVLAGQTTRYVERNYPYLYRNRRTLNTFPVAPKLTKEQKRLIEKLGRLWFEDPRRPRPKRDVQRRWNKRIQEWAETRSLPLYVRKERGNRGSRVLHKSSGRYLIPTDNSPAIWSFVGACTRKPPSLKKIGKMIDEDCIPIAFALSRKERKKAHYECDLGQLKKDQPNCKRWKFAHIEDVGLNCRGDPKNLDISKLKNHFKNLMTPSNMFVFPEKSCDLTELPEFLEQMKRRRVSR